MSRMLQNSTFILLLLFSFNSVAEKAHVKNPLQVLLCKMSKKAARNNDAAGIFNTGKCYYDGTIFKQDYPTAIRYFITASKLGSTAADAMLSDEFLNDWNTPSAYKKEAEKQLMVHRVAKLNAETDRHSIDEFNDMAAKIRLANAYYEGSGVIQNYTLAARLFYDAAMRGHQLAQYNLGQMYFNGQGVTQDYVQAYAWWSVPKKHPRSLPRVLSKLNHEELVEAKALALQYRQMTQSR